MRIDARKLKSHLVRGQFMRTTNNAGCPPQYCHNASNSPEALRCVRLAPGRSPLASRLANGLRPGENSERSRPCLPVDPMKPRIPGPVLRAIWAPNTVAVATNRGLEQSSESFSSVTATATSPSTATITPHTQGKVVVAVQYSVLCFNVILNIY